MYAMLRKIVQSAYEAVLARRVNDPGFALKAASITIEITPDRVVVQVGTTVTAELAPAHGWTEEDARESLRPYVRYLPVRVTINGTLASQEDYRNALFNQQALTEVTTRRAVISGSVEATIRAGFDAGGRAAIEARDVRLAGRTLGGEVLLAEGGGAIVGMRDYFGLAPLPIATFFELGGVVNLSCLQADAGGDALAAESVRQASAIVAALEAQLAILISESDFANRSESLHRYIVQHGRYDLAGRIAMDIAGCDLRVRMDQLRYYRHRASYVVGRDTSWRTYERDGELLLVADTDEPRRQIQLHCLREAGIPPDGDGSATSG